MELCIKCNVPLKDVKWVRENLGQRKCIDCHEKSKKMWMAFIAILVIIVSIAIVYLIAFSG